MTSNSSGEGRASIAQILGADLPLLPGESREEYLQGVHATIDELQARTPLQVYLAQKIFDCLWWIKRYERRKVTMLIVEMAKRVTEYHMGDGLSGAQARIVVALQNNDWQDKVLRSHMEARYHTPETLMEEAAARLASELVQVDQQISLRVKTLAGLQSSYEALVNRVIHAERLRLQTQLLRRDLASIDVPPLEASSQPHLQAPAEPSLAGNVSSSHGPSRLSAKARSQ
jgi:hypothetical protein